jgi:hypothetical protein
MSPIICVALLQLRFPLVTGQSSIILLPWEEFGSCSWVPYLEKKSHGQESQKKSNKSGFCLMEACGLGLGKHKSTYKGRIGWALKWSLPYQEYGTKRLFPKFLAPGRKEIVTGNEFNKYIQLLPQEIYFFFF